MTLFDAEGATLSSFQPAIISTIVHSRNVTKSKGEKQANIRFDITVNIKTESAINMGVWNGTMTENYNGQILKSGTMENITRIWDNGRFHFPIKGTLDLDRQTLHFNAEFLGDGKAQFKIKNKLNKKSHVIFVDEYYKETTPVEST